MSILQIIYWLMPVLAMMTCLLMILEIILLVNLKRKAVHLHKRKKRDNKKKQMKLKQLILYLLVGLLLLSGLSMGLFYVRTNQLVKEDKKIVIESHNIITDLEKEIQLMEDKKVEQADFEKTMATIGSIMATKGLHKASDFYPEKNQQLLNRYFNSVNELGILLSNDVNSLYDNQKRVDELKSDIKKVSQYEEKVNKKYRINKKATSKGAGV